MKIFELYRIKDWFKNLGICLLAIVLSASKLNLLYFLPIVQFSLAYSFVFSLNDYFDYKISQEKNFVQIIIRKGSKEKSLLLKIFFPLIILIPTFWLNSFNSLLFLLLFLLLSSIYSLPKFGLKKNFLFSIPANSFSIGAFSFLSSYFFVSEKLDFKGIMFTVIFILLIAIYEIIHQISHIKEDKKSKIKSLPVVFGVQKSLKIAIFIQSLILTIALISLLMNFWSNLVFLGTVVFSILRIFRIRRWKNDFSKLRTKIFGFEEGSFYLIVISLRYI
jgi:4-hydroxybenzoate polyprenyltransferase